MSARRIALLLTAVLAACRASGPALGVSPSATATPAPTAPATTSPTGSGPSTSDPTTTTTGCTPIDLTSAAEVEALIEALTDGFGVRGAVEDLVLPYRYGDDVCPAWSGLDPEVRATGITNYFGGCVSFDPSYAFTGEVSVDQILPYFDPGPHTWRADSAAWEVAGTGMTFDVLELAGSASWTWDDADYSFTLDGVLVAFRGSRDPAATLDATFPEGVSGTIAAHADEGSNAPALSLAADLDVTCRSALSADFDWQAYTPDEGGVYAGPYLSGSGTLSSGGHVVDLDLDLDETPDGCVPWSLDGVPQPGAICVW